VFTAVADTNVLVSAAIYPDSVPHRVIGEWKEGAYELVVSARLLAEVGRVLGSPKFDLPRSDVEAALAELREGAELIEDPVVVEPVVPRDPKDDFVVALARAAGAHVIVSGDRHLLELEDLQPRAVTPRQFLALLHAHER